MIAEILGGLLVIPFELLIPYIYGTPVVMASV
jgi:hypothetical protein